MSRRSATCGMIAMADIVIAEFMDERVICEDLAGRDVLYDAALASKSIAEQKEIVRHASALIVRNQMQVTEELLSCAGKLRVIGRLGVGLDNIDLAYCARRGIEVCPALNGNSLSVAEYVLMAALMLLRGCWQLSGQVTRGEWPRAAAGQGRELAGKQIGFVGFGAIAQLAGEKAAALGLTVAAHDPYLSGESAAWRHVRNLSLDELLRTSDIISLHVPLTRETKHLIDAAAIAKMKPQAVLINSARGGIVDEQALIRELSCGKLAGAAVDVFAHEPLRAPAADAFRGVPNLLLSPHIAGVTVESNVRISRLTVQNVLRHLQ